jgi:NAD(P)-dependent dehydrogenase (short-subunit alcohol dehydrogenase family)
MVKAWGSSSFSITGRHTYVSDLTPTSIIAIMSTKAFAVIAGVGSGTGSSLARRFAKEYPIALLARNPESYEPLVQEINNGGGKAIGISTDASDEESLKSAFKTIAEKYDNAPCAAAIYNASGGFVRKPFLETRIEDLEKGWGVTVYEPGMPKNWQ